MATWLNSDQEFYRATRSHSISAARSAMGQWSARLSRLLPRRLLRPWLAKGSCCMRAIRLVCFVGFMVGVAGCTVGPDYHQPQVMLPEQFAAAPPPSAAVAVRETIDPGNWWHALGDSKLDSLIDRAISAN